MERPSKIWILDHLLQAYHGNAGLNVFLERNSEFKISMYTENFSSVQFI